MRWLLLVVLLGSAACGEDATRKKLDADGDPNPFGVTFGPEFECAGTPCRAPIRNGETDEWVCVWVADPAERSYYEDVCTGPNDVPISCFVIDSNGVPDGRTLPNCGFAPLRECDCVPRMANPPCCYDQFEWYPRSGWGVNDLGDVCEGADHLDNTVASPRWVAGGVNCR